MYLGSKATYTAANTFSRDITGTMELIQQHLVLHRLEQMTQHTVLGTRPSICFGRGCASGIGAPGRPSTLVNMTSHLGACTIANGSRWVSTTLRYMARRSSPRSCLHARARSLVCLLSYLATDADIREWDGRDPTCQKLVAPVRSDKKLASSWFPWCSVPEH